MPDHNADPDRNLVRVVQFASALSLGTLAAVLYSVKSVTPQLRFGFSLATVAAFVLAAVTSVAFWHVVFQLSGLDNTQVANQTVRKRWFGLLAAMLGLGLIVGFAYPLRGFSKERLSEIGLGTAIAIVFLTALALLFWRVVRYLEDEGSR